MQATGAKRQHFSTRNLTAAPAFAHDRRSPRVGLVSVIIPAYNEAATVERTISSVLNQTYSNLEVLVVDDGSTDETAVLVQRMADVDPRIRLLQKANGGLVSARNYGIAHAGGEFIAPIDADDVWHPEKIKKQVAVMRDRGDQVGLVYCWSRAIDDQDRVLWDVSPCSLRGNVYAALIIRNFLPSGAPLVRRRCVEEIGGYDATLSSRGVNCCEDLKFNLDIAECFDFDLVPEFLFSYRVRAGSMSTNIDAMLRSREVVTEEVRARHPELPAKLFRWASGHQHREFGLAHLSSGHYFTGAQLLLRALGEDPLATLRVGLPRVLARLWRSSGLTGLVRATLHIGDDGGIAKRKFLEIDPTACCGRPRGQWSRKRLAYVTGLQVKRGPAFPASAVSGRVQRIASANKRFRQLLSHDIRDLLWLGYVVGIAPWAHRAAGPIHQLQRWQVRRRRQRDLDHRMELLRARIARPFLAQDSYRVTLAELCPELDKICRPLRRPGVEITLADIDQDGFLRPRFERFWAAPCVDADAFLPRSRFELAVVDRDGWVGMRKDFRGSKIAFVNELEAALDLTAAGCHVPAVLGVDFERLSITFAYINGVVVREALAKAGAPMRDRDVRPSRSPLAYRRIQQERRAAGRRLVDKVLDPETIARTGRALLAIHRAGYTLEDVKYGNVIIEGRTNTPYFVDCEGALPLRQFSRMTTIYLRDRDADKLNQLFGINLFTANVLRSFRLGARDTIYSPFYAGAGIWWGAIWNPDLGMVRWRHTLAKRVPVPHGGRVLDLGANNGFNALQMLRAGAREVIGVEIDTGAIEQGMFVKRVFEWADNTEYRFSYIHGSHADIGSLNLDRFDLITAFCTLYYLSTAAMTKTVSDLARLTDILVLQCNNDRSIERSDPETYTKASLPFNIELVRNNGFPNVTVIERRGSNRPLVIARTR